MRLVHEDFTFTMDFAAEPVQVLIVEEPLVLYEFVQDLSEKMDGAKGKFVLSEGISEVRLDKAAALITVPFRIDLNQRKVLTELYRRLQRLSMEEGYYIRSNEIASQIQDYMTELLLEFDSTLILSAEIDFAGLFKLAGIQFDEMGLSYPDKILSFMRIMREFGNVSLFVFVHLLPIFPLSEWSEFFDHVKYEGYSVLLLEHAVPEGYNGIKSTIIDSDLCEVY